MEVTNVKDHVTHAVIGKHEAHAFGISDSAAFFRVLSASLYSNKPLAVVREIMCNAWDAHIEGKVDRPIEVTLDRTQLIIRDFGTGLSPEQIINNYTTYGGTTKIENEEVTGGFGLGSKAPFAYVDHFEVTSWHEGTKTIWNLSLSSALVEGKPQVMKIVDIPTTEPTGIQVSLKLKQSYDYDTFNKLLTLIAKFGEMNVKLNERILDKLPFTEAEHGFLILDKATMPMESEAKIWIRYGHVVYPLETHADFRAEYDRAKQFLKDINGNNAYRYGNETRWVLILQAAPNSISITPSRESLSMTDFTIENCRKLLANFSEVIKNGMDNECREIVEKAISLAWKMPKAPKGYCTPQQARLAPGNLLNYDRKLPNPTYFDQLGTPECIRTMKDAAHNYLSCKNYPASPAFLEKDMDMRLEMMLKTNMLDKVWVGSFKAALKKARRKNGNGLGYDRRDPWFYRKVLGPLLTILDAQKTLKKEWLHAYITDRWNSELKVRPVKDIAWKVQTLGQVLPWLRKIVILSHNRMDVTDRAHLFPIIKDYLGKPYDSFVYILPRHQGRCDEARELFGKLGFTIIDLTKRQKWEPEETMAPIAAKAGGPPKRKGLTMLSNFLIHDKTKLSLTEGFKLDVPHEENPEFVIVISPTRSDFPRIEPFGNRNGSTNLCIARLYGHRIGIAANSTQLDRYVKKGSKRLTKDIYSEMLLEYQTDPKIEEFYRNYRAEGSGLPYEQDKLLSLIRADDILRSHFKLPDPLTGTAKDVIALFESFYDWEHSNDKNLKEIAALVKSWTVSPELKAVLDQIKDNQLVSMVDTGKVRQLVLSGDAAKAKQARDFLVLAMKG